MCVCVCISQFGSSQNFHVLASDRKVIKVKYKILFILNAYLNNLNILYQNNVMSPNIYLGVAYP